MTVDQPSAALADSLRQMVAERFGRYARVRNLQRMSGGHAGFTYGFELHEAEHARGRPVVIKLGPQGVRRAGVADVFRQAALLHALHEHGIAVPRILWASAEESEVGAPYIVMERVIGRERFALLAAGEQIETAEARALWDGALTALATLAAFPADRALAGWEPAVDLPAEFASWEPTLRKSPQPEWIDAGLRARDALLRCLPCMAPHALVHGDFQPSNLLFDGGMLRAIIDWDLAHVGSAGLDLGWLMMFADPDYWGSHWRTHCPFSTAEMLRRFGQRHGGWRIVAPWFHAYAGYRFGAIACLNVRLHRNGRRPDPIWERFALDIPILFARARELAGRLDPS